MRQRDCVDELASATQHPSLTVDSRIVISAGQPITSPCAVPQFHVSTVTIRMYVRIYLFNEPGMPTRQAILYVCFSCIVSFLLMIS